MNNRVAFIALVVIMLALFGILALHDSGLDTGAQLFNSYVDIILENESGDTRRYMAVAYSEYTKAIDPFESAPIEIWETREGAFETEMIDQQANNRLVDETLISQGEAAFAEGEALAILRLVEGMNSAVRRAKLIECEGCWFAQVTVYIDAWETNAFYQYLPNENRLMHLGSFAGQEIIGLRLTDSSRSGAQISK
ncbi:MAG: hypothetical protein IJ234_06070 [Clostridia bacterium]|nr:hypothetical protein [Clostridia bacterium]